MTFLRNYFTIKQSHFPFHFTAISSSFIVQTSIYLLCQSSETKDYSQKKKKKKFESKFDKVAIQIKITNQEVLSLLQTEPPRVIAREERIQSNAMLGEHFLQSWPAGASGIPISRAKVGPAESRVLGYTQAPRQIVNCSLSQ